MRLIRLAALSTAIGVTLLLAGCSTASTDDDHLYTVAAQLRSQISELSGVQVARVGVDAPYPSWASVAVRLDYDTSSADKHSTLVKIGELLLAEPAFDDYQLQAIFDSPHELPLGSAFVVVGLESADQFAEEAELWLTITATVPAVGIAQFAKDAWGEGHGVQILPSIRPDGTVPSEDEVEAMIEDVTELPHDFFVDTEGQLATQ